MWPDRVSNPGPLALELDALPTALRGPATSESAFADVKADLCLGCLPIS